MLQKLYSNIIESPTQVIKTDICQICFDLKTTYALPDCKDRFCTDCFSCYIETKLELSWGIGYIQVLCPCCSKELTISDWKNLVSCNMVEKFISKNLPFQPFQRFCQLCSHSTSAFVHGPVTLEDITSQLRFGTFNQWDSKQDFITWFYDRLKTPVSEIYSAMLDEASFSLTFSQLTSLSVLIINSEKNPGVWNRLQFHHIKRFPGGICKNCSQEICFRCGEASQHTGLTCKEFLMAQNVTPSTQATIQWQLRYCRPCNLCGITIQIGVEDGCLRTSCPHCHTTMCAACGLSNEDCSYFQCSSPKFGSKMSSI